MARSLTQPERDELFRSFEREAFRLELQHLYTVPHEATRLAQWRAGEPQSPLDDQGFRAWCQQVTERSSAGALFVRVRVHDEPPNDYQQWLQWLSRWNTEAGETISYMTRHQAHEVGLLPDAGPADWWLFDSTQLVLLHFDDEGHRVGITLDEDPEAVSRACEWRDLALSHSRIGPWTQSPPTG